MPTITSNGITLEYDRRGPQGGATLLMVMGLGAQRIFWPDPMLDALAVEGFDVISFDNRDVGQSTWFDEAPGSAADIPMLMAGQNVEIAYPLSAMAKDAAGLLDGLDVEKAHVVGASMGGMIAHHLAFGNADRVASLTSIMSTTGNRTVGQPSPQAWGVLLAPPPKDRAAVIAARLAAQRVIGSVDLLDEEAMTDMAGRAFDRGFNPRGVARQMLAVLADGDRTERLADVTAPTLVLHGAIDKLVDPSGGRATAAAIPGARFEEIPRMGHDLPGPLIPRLVQEIASHVRKA